MESERVFIDTWGWLVLGDSREPAFANVARAYQEACERERSWITTDYVLDETITRLFAARPYGLARRYVDGVFGSAQAGTVVIQHVTPERFRSAWQLRQRYADKPKISFTDLTSFVVMRELGLTRVLSGDAHFEQVGMGFRRLPA